MQVVVAGTGRWGQIHCEKVQTSAWATLAGVVDPNAAHAQRAADMFNVPVFESIAKCSEAEFVIIATPWREVAGLVEQSCSLGLSFLAEKPVSISSDALHHLQQLTMRSKVVGCVGYQLRFHPRLEHFDVSDSLCITREERTFDSLWAMVCDCGVHDIDLAIRLAGEVSRLTEVRLEGTRVNVSAVTVRGVDVHWQWRMGTQVIRSLESGAQTIDFTQASEDLLSNQWAGVHMRCEKRPSAVAGLSDAYAVASVLDALRSRGQIA